MKKTRFLSIITSAVVAMSVLFATPVFAEDGDNANSTTIEPTFSEEVSQNNDSLKLRFGQNHLFAGNDFNINSKTSGLLFAFGNQMDLGSQSEYAFVAGNLVNYSATTEKDLFVAGNIIDIKADSKIGRDIYAAGYRVILASDLAGDFSATANQIVLRDVEIAGNVNLSAAYVSFEENVSIAGTLTYNTDAQVVGLERVKAAQVETYTPEDYAVSAAELWLAKLMSIISLALLAIVVLAFSSRLRDRVAGESATSEFGANLVAGFIALLAVPVLIVLCLMSYFAAPLGLILVVVYIVSIYLAQALAGAWLGHLLINKLFRSQAHVFIEAVIGVIILTCLSMIPGLNVLVGFLATLLGLGIAVRSLKSKSKAAPNEPVLIASHPKKSSTQAAKTAKNTKTAKVAKPSVKSTKSTKKSTTKKKA